MAHAEICLICGGKGFIAETNPATTSATKTCPGCGGGCWITVQDDPPVYIVNIDS